MFKMGSHNMYNHLLIAIDGSDLSKKALRQGLALAKALAAKVTVVTVTQPLGGGLTGGYGLHISPTEYAKAATDHANHVLDDAAKIAGLGQAIDALHVADEYPAEAILTTAEERKVDLIVMAPHHRRAVEWFLFGSETSRVLAEGDKSILIVR